MVTICQLCGVEGLPDALINCYNCRVFAIHRYCLHVLPASILEHVIWYCEDCESEVEKPYNFYKTSLLRKTYDSKSIRTIEGAQSVSRLKKNAVDRLANKVERDASGSLSKLEDCSGKNVPHHYPKVQCHENHGKDQKLKRCRVLGGNSSDEEAGSVRTKTSWTADRDITSNPEQSCQLHHNESDEEGESVKTKTSAATSVLSDISQLGCYDYKQPSVDLPWSQNDNMDYQYQIENGLVKGSSDGLVEYVELISSQGAASDPSNIRKPISYIDAKSINEVHCGEKNEKDQSRRSRRLNQVIWDEEAASVGAKTSPTSAIKPSNIFNRRFYIPAEPIVKPLWNGSLSLSDESYGTVGIAAHLSTLACAKVVEEAKLLPCLLCVELLPRSDAWPKSFGSWGAHDDNIGLFLFPNSESEEMVYDGLVEDMIQRDLAMRASVENAELLIFTSKMLSSQFWRIQAKFYLWGLFRGKQASDVSKAVVRRDVKDLTNNFSYAESPLLAEATKEVFGSLNRQNETSIIEDEGSDVSVSCRKISVSDATIPEWAKLLEPVRKLPTNKGTRIRNCIYEALEKDPPGWAKRTLELSISKFVYKGKASGPTKKAVLRVLANLHNGGLPEKSDKGRKRSLVFRK